MRPLTLLLLAAVAIAISFGAHPAIAQDEPAAEAPTPLDAPPSTVTVALGPYDFEVDGNEALTACVVKRDETLDGIFVEVQLFVRLATGDVIPGYSFDTRAVGTLAESHVDSCFILAPEGA